VALLQPRSIGWSLHPCLRPQTSSSRSPLRLIANASRRLLLTLPLREPQASRLRSVLFASMLGPARDNWSGGPRHWITLDSAQPYRRAPPGGLYARDIALGFMQRSRTRIPRRISSRTLLSCFVLGVGVRLSVRDALRLLPCVELDLSPALGFACAPRVAVLAA
jgi:hypothetical protein